MKSLNRCTYISGLAGLCLVAATGAYAQISSINSIVITPRVSNDYPGATGTYLDNYPTSITLGESGEYGATGYANKDMWAFSNDGTTAYTLGAGDTSFRISATLTITGDNTVDNEAGFYIPGGTTGWPGGDMYFIAKPSGDQFIGFFGGPGFWSGSVGGGLGPYTTGPVTMTLTYWQTGATGNMQFSASYNGNTAISPVQTWTGNMVGTQLEAYYQLQGMTTAPGSTGQAVWSDISISNVPEPTTLALLGLGLLPLARLFRRRA